MSQRLSLLRLPEEIQQAVETGRLGVHDALRLAKAREPGQHAAARGLYPDQREDAWITSVDQAIAAYADRTVYQARREATLARAAAEGIQVVDPVEEFGRQLPAHRFTDPEQVAAARLAGPGPAAGGRGGPGAGRSAAGRATASGVAGE